MELTLRPLVPEDAAHLRDWSHDDETARLLGAREHGLTEAEAEAEVSRIISGNGVEHHAFMIDADGRTIGNCWLGHLIGDSASLGIAIGEPAYRGRGIGTKVMRQLLEFARSHGMQRVHLWTLATNAPAIRCYRGVGFTETGRQMRDVPGSGHVETINMSWGG